MDKEWEQIEKVLNVIGFLGMLSLPVILLETADLRLVIIVYCIIFFGYCFIEKSYMDKKNSKEEQEKERKNIYLAKKEKYGW